MDTVLWSQVYEYSSTSVRVARLTKGWRLERPGGRAVERRSLVEAFDELLGHRVGGDEMKVVLAALTADPAVQSPSAADAPLSRDPSSG